MKDYITAEDSELEIKELLIKYADEIAKISKHERETDAFGFYNAWWVFGEVAKESEVDYSIFMAEAENVGYKRTKRGENPMPNDLYDLEYSPTTLDCKKVIAKYDDDIKHFSEMKKKTEKDKAELDKKYAVKKNVSVKNKIDRIIDVIEDYAQKITKLQSEKIEVAGILKSYYEDDSLKDEYIERTDNVLINHFKNGLLSRYKSDDIVLRETTQQTILDAIRQEVVWG